MEPKVSFIVPCYNLAHFLADCVNSILSQTYGDFEILIMDDCSPDNTQEMAAEFKDPRVIYVRNETNLGNLRNFNKGIELSKGLYIWLISADDRLRTKDVLRKYIDLLEQNPKIGYVFCPAINLEGEEETEVGDWTAWPGNRDRILTGREVVRRSAYRNPVSAPTGFARKECYRRVGGFPPDLKRTADYYLWAVFATMYDVGYFAEPMINYRLHTTNMTKILEGEEPSSFLEEETLVRWCIKRAVENAGMQDLSTEFCRGLALEYVSIVARSEVEKGRHCGARQAVIGEIKRLAKSDEEAEQVLRCMNAALPNALAQLYNHAGAKYYKSGQLDRAIDAFRSAVASRPWRFESYIYLGSTKLEQMSGIRLIPLLRWLKSGLLGALVRQFRRT